MTLLIRKPAFLGNRVEPTSWQAGDQLIWSVRDRVWFRRPSLDLGSRTMILRGPAGHLPEEEVTSLPVSSRWCGSGHVLVGELINYGLGLTSCGTLRWVEQEFVLQMLLGRRVFVSERV